MPDFQFGAAYIWKPSWILTIFAASCIAVLLVRLSAEKSFAAFGYKRFFRGYVIVLVLSVFVGALFSGSWADSASLIAISVPILFLFVCIFFIPLAVVLCVISKFNTLNFTGVCCVTVSILIAMFELTAGLTFQNGFNRAIGSLPFILPPLGIFAAIFAIAVAPNPGRS